MSDALPRVDEGALPHGFPALLQELGPRPGRLADTLRLVVLVLATVAISETFRMPETAVSAYVVLFVSRSERSSTVMTATVACAAVVFAVFATIVVFMASLSEPALRVPLIAAATFAALFFSRISPLGPAGFAAGFILAYGLTLGDQVSGLALQSSEASNTTASGLSELFFIPPEEALLHFLMWLAPMVVLPVGLVVVCNLLTGRHPILLLRTGLADRLAACAGFCDGEAGAPQALAASAREGSAAFAKLNRFAGLSSRPPDYVGLIHDTQQLALALLAWPLIAGGTDLRHALGLCAEGFRVAERSLRANSVPTVSSPTDPIARVDAAGPLAAEIAHASAAIFQALRQPSAVPPKAVGTGHHLISVAAIRDPNSTRFALKVTLAVMLSYAAESLLDWPAIHTCVVTCFFVSLGTVGESVHKATLRIAGALIGGGLGIASIVWLMPLMTDLDDLLLALAAVTLLAGWVAGGSERISYAGWQIGLAYYLTVLQGYGPTLDMQTARDRVIGIVLGNLIVLLVFTTCWPVSVEQAVRHQVAAAIQQLAALMRLEARPPTEAAAARLKMRMDFATATNAARGLMPNSGYERLTSGRKSVRRPIDTVTLAELETVMLILCVIQNLQSDPSWPSVPEAAREATRHYCERMAVWFDRSANWVQTGAGAQTLEAAIPASPELGAPELVGRAAWYGVLDRAVRAIMADAMKRSAANG